jgi:hypothetical protein
MKSDKKAAIVESFKKELIALYGVDLVSVISYYEPYGSGEKSNLLIIMKDNTPSELSLIAPQIEKWQRKGIGLPLFLTLEYIESSLDTFPLEFMNISRNYEVIYGEDVLEGISFEWADVRSQCERELKGKLLHLREEYLSFYNHSKGLSDLIGRSLEGFLPIFEGALYLKNQSLPSTSREITDKVAAEYDLDRGIFEKLRIIAIDKKIDRKEAAVIFDRYIEELDKLCTSIDSLTSEDT